MEIEDLASRRFLELINESRIWNFEEYSKSLLIIELKINNQMKTRWKNTKLSLLCKEKYAENLKDLKKH
jgi:hypothetical protein